MQKVSVIVPVYNAEKYIEKCISSVLNQNYKNIELILVNDGSTDNSLELMKKYNAIIIDKKNGGVSSARNEGLNRATGDFIMFLDSDDFLDEACILDIIKKPADIVRFKICYEYLDGQTRIEEDDFCDCSYIEKKDFKNEIYKKMLTGIKMNSICRTLYKKDVVKNIRLEENLKTAEDLLFNIEAFSNANSFLYIARAYYHYNQTNLGITGNGISILTKYKCNFFISSVLLKKLKAWGMNSFKYMLLAILRPIVITFSKMKRKRVRRC
jgi:glycosyltransferase involved in cell wall biosynthesis